MIVYIRRLFEWMKLFILFVVLTLISYALIGAMAEWLKPSYRFQVPEGRAVKVLSYETPVSKNIEMDGWERLKLFFWTGE